MAKSVLHDGNREMVLLPALATHTCVPTAATACGLFSPLPVSGLPAALPSGLNSERVLLPLDTQTCVPTTVIPLGLERPLPVRAAPAELPSALKREMLAGLELMTHTCAPTTTTP